MAMSTELEGLCMQLLDRLHQLSFEALNPKLGRIGVMEKILEIHRWTTPPSEQDRPMFEQKDEYAAQKR